MSEAVTKKAKSQAKGQVKSQAEASETLKEVPAEASETLKEVPAEASEVLEAVSVEAIFGQLDDIVKKLTDGDISLEDSFGYYETGMRLVKSCSEKIDKVEKQIIVLNEGNAEL